MAYPSQTNKEAILTSTAQRWADRNASDNVFGSTPFLYYLGGRENYVPNPGNPGTGTRGNIKVVDGGESVLVPLMSKTNSTASGYADWQPIDMTPQEGLTAARWDWTTAAVSVVISGFEERVNQGDAKMVDLLEFKMKQANSSFNALVDGWLGGTGTGTRTQLMGIQAVVSTSGTLGGIDPTTTDGAFWKTNAASYVASTGSMASGGRAKMETVYNSLVRGTDKPNLLLADTNAYGYYAATLQSFERFTTQDQADGGFQTLTYKGQPFVLANSASMPANSIYMLNLNHFTMYIQKDANFKMTDFQQPYNQDGKGAKLLLQAALVTDERALAGGALLGITA